MGVPLFDPTLLLPVGGTRDIPGELFDRDWLDSLDLATDLLDSPLTIDCRRVSDCSSC